MPLEHARPQIETLQKGNGYPFYGRRERTTIVEHSLRDDGSDGCSVKGDEQSFILWRREFLWDLDIGTSFTGQERLNRED